MPNKPRLGVCNFKAENRLTLTPQFARIPKAPNTGMTSVVKAAINTFADSLERGVIMRSLSPESLLPIFLEKAGCLPL